ncbi:MAG: alpha/beta fold hydrolase [Janthinobacterium lividum]
MQQSLLAPGEHFADVNGVTIHYTVRGSGPVLLVPAPGWGPSVSFMIPLPGLEEHCTVVYFDTRHSGRSTGPDDPTQYSLDHLVNDIDALREHIRTDTVFLAGHSGGGHQVLEYGIQHSDHLLGIIAIDAIVSADEVRTAEVMRRLAAMKDKPYYQAHPEEYEAGMAFERREINYQPTIAQILAATGGFYFHDPELAAAAFGTMHFDDALLGYSQASGFQSKNLLPELARITVPTLLVYGAEDFQCDPVTQGERAHAAMGTSQLVLIPEAGHVPWAEQPEAFAAACTSWIQHINV